MSKGSQTRQAILDRGIAMASVVGLGGVTIGGLAAELGMSKSGLYAHFQSKEALQLALLQEGSERFVDHVVVPALKHARGEPRVRALLERWFRWASVDGLPGGCIFVEASVEFDDQPGRVRERLLGSQRDWLDTLATAARIAVEEGHFRDDLDPAQFAFELVSLAHGYHFVARLLRDPAARERAQTSLERLLRDARDGARSPRP